MTEKKTDIPEPTARQIAYSRVAAAHLTVDLLTMAADALLTGSAMKPPHLPRASPTDDAVTARSLQIIARALADSRAPTQATKNEKDGVQASTRQERRQKGSPT